jgi:hypothetical protein
MNMKIGTNNVCVGSLLVVLIVALGMAGLAAAHHSFSAFDMQSEKTITGKVNKVDWTNPHIWIWVDVPNAKGGTDLYGFEGMSPNFLERRNWTRTTLKAGDTITISYRPLRDGQNGGMFVNGKMTSGKVLTGGGSSAN